MTTMYTRKRNQENVKQSHFLTAGLSPSCFLWEFVLVELLPVFLSSPALLNITVYPSAVAGSFTSQSPNFGNGLPASFDAIFDQQQKLNREQQQNTNSFFSSMSWCFCLEGLTPRCRFIMEKLNKKKKENRCLWLFLKSSRRGRIFYCLSSFKMFLRYRIVFLSV